MLQQEGLNVLWAANGKIGVTMAKDHLPDAIVLDIEMPEMNGFETCRHLKGAPETAKIPVIMLTVHTEPVALLEGIDVGAIDFIPKDAFSGSVLLETLRQLEILESTSDDSETA
jgi:CheY-like chemotaxis protein